MVEDYGDGWGGDGQCIVVGCGDLVMMLCGVEQIFFL